MGKISRDTLMDKIEELTSVDTEYHVETMCNLDDQFRATLSKEQKTMLNVLLNLHATHEQHSAKIICLHQMLDDADDE